MRSYTDDHDNSFIMTNQPCWVYQRKEGCGGGGRQTDRQTDRDRQTETETDRERERENSKTLFCKDCSLGSVKNLSNR